MIPLRRNSNYFNGFKRKDDILSLASSRIWIGCRWVCRPILEPPSLPSWVDLSDLRASDNFFILIRKQDKHKEAKEKVLFWSKRKQKHFHPFEVFLSRIKMELLEFCSGPLMFKMIWNILKGWSESRYFDVLKSGISDERLNDGSHHNQRPCYWFYIIVFKYCYVSTVVRSKESPNKYLLTWPRHSIQSKVQICIR